MDTESTPKFMYPITEKNLCDQHPKEEPIPCDCCDSSHPSSYLGLSLDAPVESFVQLVLF